MQTHLVSPDIGGTDYAYNLENTLKVIVLGQKAIQKNSRLQAYLVPGLTDIAGIISPPDIS